MSALSKPLEALDDAALVLRVQRADAQAFAALMRRYNRRLYRTARAILKDDGAAEDAVQEGYVAAWRHIGEFRGDAQIATWLTRIVVNQALQALRRTRREQVVVLFDEPPAERSTDDANPDSLAPGAPEKTMLRAEMRRLIERKIDDLPEAYRTVFMLREVEDMTVEETAAALGIPTATVRSRLFRAKARLREALAEELDTATQEVFGFDGERCDRIVAAVLARIGGVHPTG
ncbi:MAG TPA: RNA polymerase sigma factor [Casimicrobiaceae bacterium]|jgi:RNA polymerase sigma-70 factor (ECF subfamily)|nr:RNA polymerase sigma factor [Casimicrobiaceae bacterium]